MSQVNPHIETELTGSISLSTMVNNKPQLVMNPQAAGWSRKPLADTRLYTGFGGWGRNKRWEYWGIMTPTHIIGITVSSLDYAGVNQFYVVDRKTLESTSIEVVAPLAKGVNLPDTYAHGDASFTSKNLTINISNSVEAALHHTRITVAGQTPAKNASTSLALDVTMTRSVDDDALHVVVPWSSKRFQYTIKEPALPATGVLDINGTRIEFGGSNDNASFGVLDHGRGRWPYSMVWNWAAGSGYVDGKRVALQVGGKWTEGTGSTENAMIIDGSLYKISEELAWDYDQTDWLKPWRVSGAGLDATFTPFYERVAVTALVVLAGETHQCFGTWSGTYTMPDGSVLTLDGLEGWAEEAQNRW